MSQERAQAFIQHVNQNETLQRKVVALNGDLNGLLTMAAEAGFSFSADEWRTVIPTMESGELSESDLANIASGAWNLSTPAAPSPIPIPYPIWPK